MPLWTEWERVSRAGGTIRLTLGSEPYRKDLFVTEGVVRLSDVYAERKRRIATVAGPKHNFGRLYPEAIIFTTTPP